MHGTEPDLYVDTLLEWVATLDSGLVKVDVHAHYVPDGYRAALERAGHDQPDGMPWIPDWSAELHLEAMERLGIDRSLLSISSPGVHLGDAAAADAVDLAREVNEAGRRAVVDHPGRFGLLASLPLPDVDAAVAEIAHCCDHLDVDGFVLLTNVGGTYVGDPSFEPVLASARPAPRPRPVAPHVAGVLAAHVVRPAATDARVLLRHHPRRGRPRARGHDRPPPRRRARSSRTPARRCRSSPTGSAAFAALLAPDVDVLGDLGRLHFDLAGFAVPRQLDALLTLTTLDHLHYGSDFPFTPELDRRGGRRADRRESTGSSTPSTPTRLDCSRWTS